MIEFAYHKMNSGGNLTRCYRTIYSMIGPTIIHLINCQSVLRKKHLHSSNGQHQIIEYDNLEEFLFKNEGKDHIIIEVNGKRDLSHLKLYDDFIDGKTIFHIGGENEHLPVTKAPWKYWPRYKVSMVNKLPLINDVITGMVCYEITR